MGLKDVGSDVEHSKYGVKIVKMGFRDNDIINIDTEYSDE